MLFNKRRLIKLMDQFSLDAVIASSSENIFYLSGFSSWSQHAYQYHTFQVFLIYPRDESQSPILLIPGDDVGYASLKDVWIKDIFTYGRKPSPKFQKEADLLPEQNRFLSLTEIAPKGESSENALSAILQEKKLLRSRIGIDQAGVPIQLMDSLRSINPEVEFLPALNFFRYVRMIKTDAEIKKLREAAKLNEIAATAMLRSGDSGRSEEELAAAYRVEIARADGKVFWLHLTTLGWNFPPIKDRILSKGDILRADMGCSLQGYQADTCRSACIGTPSDRQRLIYDSLQTGVLKSIERLAPGAYPSELYETMVQGVREAGIPSYSNFFAGHTIGLEAREFPFIIGPKKDLNDPFLPKNSDVPMEPGMVVNIEASYHELGWGSVAVEYTLVVTDGGNEHIIEPKQGLYSLPME